MIDGNSEKNRERRNAPDAIGCSTLDVTIALSGESRHLADAALQLT
jgi:hypothetical protein